MPTTTNFFFFFFFFKDVKGSQFPMKILILFSSPKLKINKRKQERKENKREKKRKKK